MAYEDVAEITVGTIFNGALTAAFLCDDIDNPGWFGVGLTVPEMEGATCAGLQLITYDKTGQPTGQYSDIPFETVPIGQEIRVVHVYVSTWMGDPAILGRVEINGVWWGDDPTTWNTVAGIEAVVWSWDAPDYVPAP